MSTGRYDRHAYCKIQGFCGPWYEGTLKEKEPWCMAPVMFGQETPDIDPDKPYTCLMWASFVDDHLAWHIVTSDGDRSERYPSSLDWRLLLSELTADKWPEPYVRIPFDLKRWARRKK